MPSSASPARTIRWPWPKQLVARHGLGLAPGAAFGPEGEGWLRWCYASRDPQRLTLGVERLAEALRALAV
jgi:aspartate/methionine/tyrosine aminotransferase